MNGTDEWRLSVTNSGTVPYSSVTMVDPLPVQQDKLLSTGAARGSQWRSVLDTAFGIQTDAPAGTTTTTEVSTDANVCIGTGTPTQWSTDPTCGANTWVPLGTYAGAPQDITGIRVIAMFPPRRPLPPGGVVTATLRTTNVPASAATPQGMSTTVPQPALADYDQYGVQATLTNGSAALAQAPVKVGVTPVTGSLEVVKKVTGGDASRAPETFTAAVACSVGGTALDLGDDATLTLDKADSFTARIDGIPLGATCTVTETGDTGAFGEDSRVVDPSAVSITTVSAAGDPVPSGQIVTITNQYDAHPTPPPKPPAGGGGVLPDTGSDLAPALALGFLLLAAGAAAAVTTRRRRRA
jgi:LPXTG-motif cell wall-anchored protein